MLKEILLENYVVLRTVHELRRPPAPKAPEAKVFFENASERDPNLCFRIWSYVTMLSKKVVLLPLAKQFYCRLPFAKYKIIDSFLMA